MGFLSDIDWMIIAVVAVFLLFGRGSGDAARTVGRWYGRALRLKQELVAEVTRAAGLPAGSGTNVASLRAALLGPDVVGLPAASHVPLHVRTPPAVAPPPSSPPTVPWTGGEPVTVWSVSGVVPTGEGGRP
jgi:hypothetical protein